jgi:hypothetical protein
MLQCLGCQTIMVSSFAGRCCLIWSIIPWAGLIWENLYMSILFFFGSVLHMVEAVVAQDIVEEPEPLACCT